MKKQLLVQVVDRKRVTQFHLAELWAGKTFVPDCFSREFDAGWGSQARQFAFPPSGVAPK
jgi:hypothetical protein